MHQRITQRELRNDSGEILRRVEGGESFTVTKNGTPVAELVPLRRQRFVPAENVLEVFRDAPPMDLAAMRADLDALISDDPTPRG